jgi:hypothetical protein
VGNKLQRKASSCHSESGSRIRSALSFFGMKRRLLVLLIDFLRDRYTVRYVAETS